MYVVRADFILILVYKELEGGIGMDEPKQCSTASLILTRGLPRQKFMGLVRFELTTYGFPIKYYKTAALTRLSYKPTFCNFAIKVLNAFCGAHGIV